MLSAIHAPWSQKGTFFKSMETSLCDLYFPLETQTTTAKGRAKRCTTEISLCGYHMLKFDYRKIAKEQPPYTHKTLT